MDENAEADFGDNDDENSLIKSLRKDLAKAQADAKTAAEENELFRSSQAQAREQAIETAVNGKTYPESVVAALKVQAEQASNDEFEKLLQDLGTSAEGSEGELKEGEAPEVSPSTQPSPADLGQRVAAAATGQAGEVDALKKIAGANTREELLSVVSEFGLDKF